jgi:hypothetical protein
LLCETVVILEGFAATHTAAIAEVVENLQQLHPAGLE